MTTNFSNSPKDTHLHLSLVALVSLLRDTPTPHQLLNYIDNGTGMNEMD